MRINDNKESFVNNLEFASAGIYDNSVHTAEAEPKVSSFPVIGPQYTAQGTLFIPYAEIAETFQAWVDLTNGQSRIDFYGG